MASWSLLLAAQTHGGWATSLAYPCASQTPLKWLRAFAHAVCSAHLSSFHLAKPRPKGWPHLSRPQTWSVFMFRELFEFICGIHPSGKKTRTCPSYLNLQPPSAVLDKHAASSWMKELRPLSTLLTQNKYIKCTTTAELKKHIISLMIMEWQ